MLDPGRGLDVTDDLGDFDPGFFAADGLSGLTRVVAERAAHGDPLPPARLGSPVADPRKIVCVGLNYAEHANEAKAELPKEPVLFFKAPNTLVGAHDDVRIPRGSTKTDWEVELGVVIGRRCRYVESDAEALASVAGYMVCNDVSERSFQLEHGGQWDKGKSCETFFPAGPWLVTPEEVDATSLDIWSSVNGRRMQDSNTRHMVFGVPELIRYISQFMVLDPGDIISTGTPAGVALGMPGEPYLRPGDVVELGVAGLGVQRQRMIRADD